MHDIRTDERRVPRHKRASFSVHPLLDLPFDHVDGFFLVGMLVEAVPGSGVDFDLNDHQRASL